MTRLECLLDQIRFAHDYTHLVLRNTAPADWYRIPPAGISHIAWQVGHLAAGRYGQVMGLIFGEPPATQTVFTFPNFMALYSKGSAPNPDPTGQSTPEILLDHLDRINAASLERLADLPDARLDAPLVRPHQLFNTVYRCLGWVSQHTLLHTGQIGLIRRQLGQTPYR